MDALSEKYRQFGDDQRPLVQALDRLPDFASGVYSPSWQLKYIPAKGQRWGQANMSRTLVIHGEVKISAGSSCPTKHNETAARIYAHNKEKIPPYKICYSQKECDDFLDGKCENPEIDWSPPTRFVQPRIDYLLQFTV